MPRLIVVVAGGSPARHLQTLLQGLADMGWMVAVQATATAKQAFATQWPAGLPTDAGSDICEAPDGLLVAPATFHTVSALAAGLNDTASLQVINRLLGSVPAVIWPHVDHQLARNPLLARNLERLADADLHVLEPAVCQGGCAAEAHWPQVIEAFGELATSIGLVADRNSRVE